MVFKTRLAFISYKRITVDIPIPAQILSITCDNASANDKMIDELKKLLPSFLGRRGHVRCMAHTVNLTAKSMIRPFDPKQPKNDENNQGNEGEDGLESGFGMEQLRAELQDLEENGVTDGDDVEGFVDVLTEMTDVEREEWVEAVMPIRKALVKVGQIF